MGTFVGLGCHGKAASPLVVVVVVDDDCCCFLLFPFVVSFKMWVFPRVFLLFALDRLLMDPRQSSLQKPTWLVHRDFSVMACIINIVGLSPLPVTMANKGL